MSYWRRLPFELFQVDRDKRSVLKQTPNHRREDMTAEPDCYLTNVDNSHSAHKILLMHVSRGGWLAAGTCVLSSLAVLEPNNPKGHPVAPSQRGWIGSSQFGTV